MPIVVGLPVGFVGSAIVLAMIIALAIWSRRSRAMPQASACSVTMGNGHTVGRPSDRQSQQVVVEHADAVDDARVEFQHQVNEVRDDVNGIRNSVNVIQNEVSGVKRLTAEISGLLMRNLGL